MKLDRATEKHLMNSNWHALVKARLFNETDFHLIPHDEYMKNTNR
jgi:hypothetical protein